MTQILFVILQGFAIFLGILTALILSLSAFVFRDEIKAWAKKKIGLTKTTK